MIEVAQGYLRELIVAELQVAADFDAQVEVERRVSFLDRYLAASGAAGFVLGISGGVDSTTTGRLCQLAVERSRRAGRPAVFVAMRLPYGLQADESDAQSALRFIDADESMTVDVQPASDATLASVVAGDLAFSAAAPRDFVLGNIKARQRMVAQFAVAGARGLLVVGTDHAAEAVMGFYTKFGDGACDLTPLSGLTKRRVRAVATTLGAPAQLVSKVPTADLESEHAGMPDEDVFGISYDDIDDFLEGKPVSERVFATIVSWHRRTRHKRALPATP